MRFNEISQRGVPDGHPIWYAPPTDPLKKIVQAQDRAVAEQVSLETAKTGYIEKVYDEPESRGTVVKSAEPQSVSVTTKTKRKATSVLPGRPSKMPFNLAALKARRVAK